MSILFLKPLVLSHGASDFLLINVYHLLGNYERISLLSTAPINMVNNQGLMLLPVVDP